MRLGRSIEFLTSLLIVIKYAAGIWLLVATYLKMPVSTTHSIIGAIIGVGLVQHAASGIKWKGVGFIVLSWVVR